MALEDFWMNLATAANQLAGGSNKWFTPWALYGYDPADFAFLDDDRRAALTQNVERFRTATDGPKKKPTPARIDEGRAAIEEIGRLLETRRFPDGESLRAQTLMERQLVGELPKWVTGISCQTGEDHMGEPAMRIWLDVTDEAVDKRKIDKHANDITDTVREAYQRIDKRRWPYVLFRSPDASVLANGGRA